MWWNTHIMLLIGDVQHNLSWYMDPAGLGVCQKHSEFIVAPVSVFLSGKCEFFGLLCEKFKQRHCSMVLWLPIWS